CRGGAAACGGGVATCGLSSARNSTVSGAFTDEASGPGGDSPTMAIMDSTLTPSAYRKCRVNLARREGKIATRREITAQIEAIRNIREERTIMDTPPSTRQFTEP